MKRIVWAIILVLLTSLVSGGSIFLSDYLEEGETTVYETEDGVYVVNLLAVSDFNGKSVFRLNEEMSKGIKDGDSYVFKDGSEIVVRDLIINEAEDGKDETYFYFYGTGEDVLELTNVSKYVLENNLCNFDGQCLNETKENCCYDCGCSDDEECTNNKCVSTEVEEEPEEDVKEEVIEKEVVKEEKEVTKKDKEKKAAYSMLAVILFFILVIAWFIFKKKKRRHIF